MGRRKSKRKPPPKKKMTGTLETQFTCPFCNHEKSCDVKMDRARNTGVISCTVCLEEFQTPITSSAHPLLSVMSWVLRLPRRQKEVPAFGRWPGGAYDQPFTPPGILFSQ
uniref:Transcription elongation factor 1 homolog n=1 Tax=Colobus angolensis palliatus TaxID=336983 RepID=A0A2K5JL15_COLAP